jgi:hypothetical protein
MKIRRVRLESKLKYILKKLNRENLITSWETALELSLTKGYVNENEHSKLLSLYYSYMKASYKRDSSIHSLMVNIIYKLIKNSLQIKNK